eukprot:Seg6883.2 transcript_id=Seg6883.2/GoldUCD/mRNA.D3Y31 product="hypothetical protein" protein_id=Seg6883.2/GoldUCD/D3Y31
MKPFYDPADRPIEPPDFDVVSLDLADSDLPAESFSNNEELSNDEVLLKEDLDVNINENNEREELFDVNTPVPDVTEPQITRPEDAHTPENIRTA